MAIAAFATLFLFGLGTFCYARRGKRVDDHPLCRSVRVRFNWPADRVGSVSGVRSVFIAEGDPHRPPPRSHRAAHRRAISPARFPHRRRAGCLSPADSLVPLRPHLVRASSINLRRWSNPQRRDSGTKISPRLRRQAQRDAAGRHRRHRHRLSERPEETVGRRVSRSGLVRKIVEADFPNRSGIVTSTA